MSLLADFASDQNKYKSDLFLKEFKNPRIAVGYIHRALNFNELGDNIPNNYVKDFSEAVMSMNNERNLREIGKRDLCVEEGFLKRHYKNMPRTMLRYAIEQFTPEKRQFYMGK